MLEGTALLPCIPKLTSLHPLSVSLRQCIRCSSSSPSLTTVSLSPRERRQLRNERREKNASVTGNWREEVEDLLAQKPSKEYSNWKEKLNLDNLAKLGLQWWTVRISRVNGQETADRLSRALARGFPDMHFKVYLPTVREKIKLKNGSYSDKVKSLYPGCLFLQCVLNKEVHDYIRDCDGIGGFLGAKVGNTKRQITKPKPIAVEDMEKIFQDAKEQQQYFDKTFERDQHDLNFNYHVDSIIPDSKKITNAGNQSREDSRLSGSITLSEDDIEHLSPGATVRVLSGPFAEFSGCVKGLDHKNKKATIGFTLFGKESFVDLEVEQIVPEKDSQ